MVARDKQGVFSPEDVDDMRKELEQGATPDETANDRNLRAVDIIEHRTVERPGQSASTTKR